MYIRIFALAIVIFCAACQGGKIPCPRVKTAKLQKNYRPSASLISAKANREEQRKEAALQRQGVPVSNVKYVQDVKVEDWDCPHPGAKRYKPKAVKENIRRNMKKIESGPQTKVDSVAVQ